MHTNTRSHAHTHTGCAEYTNVKFKGVEPGRYNGVEAIRLYTHTHIRTHSHANARTHILHPIRYMGPMWKYVSQMIWWSLENCFYGGIWVLSDSYSAPLPLYMSHSSHERRRPLTYKGSMSHMNESCNNSCRIWTHHVTFEQVMSLMNDIYMHICIHRWGEREWVRVLV